LTRIAWHDKSLFGLPLGLLFSSMLLVVHVKSLLFFFFSVTHPPQIYTLSLHDALPISRQRRPEGRGFAGGARPAYRRARRGAKRDRKSTRLNSSHRTISYAVFCLKKKKQA